MPLPDLVADPVGRHVALRMWAEGYDTATALAVVSVVGASQEDTNTLVYVAAIWWCVASLVGLWLGRRAATTPGIATLLVGAPFVTTLPVYMYTASVGYELQIASVTAIALMAPGAVLLVLLERFLKSDYLVFFGQV